MGKPLYWPWRWRLQNVDTLLVNMNLAPLLATQWAYELGTKCIWPAYDRILLRCLKISRELFAFVHALPALKLLSCMNCFIRCHLGWNKCADSRHPPALIFAICMWLFKRLDNTAVCRQSWHIEYEHLKDLLIDHSNPSVGTLFWRDLQSDAGFYADNTWSRRYQKSQGEWAF